MNSIVTYLCGNLVDKYTCSLSCRLKKLQPSPSLTVDVHTVAKSAARKSMHMDCLLMPIYDTQILVFFVVSWLTIATNQELTSVG